MRFIERPLQGLVTSAHENGGQNAECLYRTNPWLCRSMGGVPMVADVAAVWTRIDAAFVFSVLLLLMAAQLQDFLLKIQGHNHGE